MPLAAQPFIVLCMCIRLMWHDTSGVESMMEMPVHLPEDLAELGLLFLLFRGVPLFQYEEGFLLLATVGVQAFPVVVVLNACQHAAG